MSEDEIRINVIIAERNYRLIIKKTDEEKVMQAVTMLNERVKSHKQTYDYRDYQDLLSMVCLQLATLNVKYESDAAYKDQYLEQKLEDISVLLSENINSKESSLKDLSVCSSHDVNLTLLNYHPVRSWVQKQASTCKGALTPVDVCVSWQP